MNGLTGIKALLPEVLKSLTSTVTHMRFMHPASMKAAARTFAVTGFKKITFSTGIILPVMLLSAGCSNIPEAVESSEIPGQLNDGGWVMNIPGQPHTHHVVLEACPDKPVITRHVHTRLQEEQLGKGPHKHKGCFVCPPANPLVKRILN